MNTNLIYSPWLSAILAPFLIWFFYRLINRKENHFKVALIYFILCSSALAMVATLQLINAEPQSAPSDKAEKLRELRHQIDSVIEPRKDLRKIHKRMA